MDLETLQTVAKNLKEVAKLYSAPRLEGIPSQLIDPMTRLGYFPNYGVDEPGYADDIEEALKPDAGMIYGLNKVGNPRIKKWYEYGEDLSVASAIGDYSAFLLRFFGEAFCSKEKAVRATNNKIKKIREDFPVDYASVEAMESRHYHAQSDEILNYLNEARNQVLDDDNLDDSEKYSALIDVWDKIMFSPAS